MNDHDHPTGDGTIQPGAGTIGLGDAPSTWFAAEGSAPHGGREPIRSRRRRRVPAVPARSESPMITNLAAVAVGAVTAAGWYGAALLDLYRGPWVAVGAGAAIGLTLRAASRAHPSHRALVASSSYLLVLLVVTMLLTHHDLVALYGPDEAGLGQHGRYSSYERSVVRDRLQDPVHLCAYGLGGVFSAILPLVGRRR